MRLTVKSHQVVETPVGPVVVEMVDFMPHRDRAVRLLPNQLVQQECLAVAHFVRRDAGIALLVEPHRVALALVLELIHRHLLSLRNRVPVAGCQRRRRSGYSRPAWVPEHARLDGHTSPDTTARRGGLRPVECCKTCQPCLPPSGSSGHPYVCRWPRFFFTQVEQARRGP